MSFCIGLSNFTPANQTTRCGVMTLCRFLKMAATELQSLMSFGFNDDTRLRRPKSIGNPNFDEISQSTSEILLLPLWFDLDNCRPPTMCVSVSVSWCLNWSEIFRFQRFGLKLLNYTGFLFWEGLETYSPKWRHRSF